MKKFTLIFMLLISLRSFAQLPLQDFEGTWTPLTGTSGPAGPSGWYIRNERGPIQKWGQVNSTVQPVHSGNNAAYINRENVVDGTTTEDWLITPAFNVPNNAQLKFWSSLTLDGDQSTIYKIFIGTDPTNISTFTEIQTWNELDLNPVQTTYTEKIVNIPATYTNQSLYIAFVMQGDNGDRWLVDDVQVAEQCFVPANLAATALSTTATITWTGSSAGYEIEVVPFNTTPTGTGTQVNTTTFTTPATLTPSTTYSAYVRGVCGTTNTSAWAGPLNFTTTQIPANLNFTDNFETLPSQWSLVNGTQTNQWYIGAPGANSGTNGLFISNTGGTTNNYSTGSASVVHAYRDILIPANADQANLSFNWRSYGETSDVVRVWLVPASYTPVAGTRTSAANSGGIQVGGALQLNGSWSTSNTVVNIAPYAGTVRRLIFEWSNDLGGGLQTPAALDNINLSIITCPSPANLTLVSANQNSANITWTAPASVSPTYDFYFSTINTAPTAGTSPTANVPTANLPLNSLSPLTTYYVWVRSNCGSGDTSTWTGPLQFTTTQVPATLTYNQDFEGTTNFSFTNVNANANNWVVGTATANSGTKSLYVSNDNGTTNAYASVAGTVIHAFRDVMIPAGTNEIGVSFNWKAQGENNMDYMRVWLVPSTFTPVGGTQITTANSGGTQVGGNFGQNNAWSTYNNNVSSTAFAGRICRVVFEWNNNGFTTNQPPAAVDNLNIQAVTCPRPTALTANAEGTTAYLSWTPGGTETQWEVYVTPATGGTVPTASTLGTPANTNVNFPYSPLAPVTTYNYYVRAVCSSTDKSLWVGPYSFTTPVVNDNCSGAISLTVSPNETCTSPVSGTFLGAYPSTATLPACSGISGPDVWYKFTATNSSNIVSLSNIGPVAGNNAPNPTRPLVISVYENACDNLTPIGCSIQNYLRVKDLVPGQEYFVRISQDSATPATGFTYSICVSTPPPPTAGNASECLITTINSSFENPVWANPTNNPNPIFYSDNQIQGWKTTANDHVMEFWPTNTENVPAYDGVQFIEINANDNQGVMGIYQDFATPSPTTFTIKFAHRGRRGTDVMEILAGDASQSPSTYTTRVGNRTFSTGNSAWVYYGADNSITYTVPAGQTVTRFFFKALSTATGNSSIGNFLDAITFTADNSIITTSPVAASCTNNVVSINARGDGNWVAHTDNPSATTIANTRANNTTISGFSVPGIYLYDWVTSYCTSTLTVNYTAPVIALPTTTQDTYTYCAGQSATTLSATADTGFTLHWYDVATGGTELTAAPTPSTATAGTFMYYASQSNGTCEGARLPFTITVNAVPNAPVGSNVVYCKNTTAAPLTATADSGNTLHWYTSANGGTELASAPTPDTSITGSTNYYVSQKSAAGCESARTTINVTVNAPATQPTAFTLVSEACIAGTNPQASLNTGTTTGGTFTSSDPTRLVIDPVTGIINLAASTAGTYDVIYTVQADTANCLALSSSRNQIVIKALNPADVAFTYATVCKTSANIFPVPASAATFTTGGTYTSSSGALVINPSTGEINVAASTPGDYTVTYSVTANSTSCTDAAVSAAIPVTIKQLSVPNTTYSYNPVCGLATTLTPQTDPGFVRGGTFSTTAAAGLLSINPVNGEIDLTTRTPGTYTVFYNLPQDNVNCTAAAINIPATVIITAPTVPVTQFNYSSTNVCSSTTANLTVQEFTGFTRGGTFGYTQGSGLAINTTTGSIDVANSTPGTYDVFYTVLPDVTNCIAGATSTPVRIAIVPTTTPEVGFTYETNYCYGTGTVTPFTNPGFNTTGTFTVTGGLSINATTGQLSLANATPGSYTVAYTVAADPSNCALGNTTSFTFNLAGEIEFAVDGACEGPSFIISTTPVNNSFNDAAASYEWTTASGVTVGDNSENFNVSKYIQTINNPVYPMVFNVKVTVGNCTKTLPYTVDGITCQIQRGISPGGTAGLNDNFDLSGFGVKKISIFNRYGKEVYSKTNYVNEWHGQTSNGDELPTGTYFYMIDSESAGQKTGWIYINRAL